MLKGLFFFGFVFLIIAIVVSIFWLMSGFFDKFEYKPDSKIEDEKGKGALKLF